MAKKNNTQSNDETVQKLFKVVQQKKSEIAKLEKPNWLTNCSFSFDRGSSNRINLQVVSDVDALVDILGFLIGQEKGFNEANIILNTNAKFKWQGFTLDEWQSDIKTRIDKITISTKKRELDLLETRLNSLISPDLRAQMELEEISKLLGN